jgi:hypothetical protein
MILNMKNKTTAIAFLAIILCNSSVIASSIFDPKLYGDEKAMIEQLLKYQNEKVNTDACNSKTLHVKDVLSQFILLSSVPETVGRKKGINLNCKNIPEGNATKGTNCVLTFSEKIQLPNEPEGWSRNLFFAFDPKKKTINHLSFRCVDIP